MSIVKEKYSSNRINLLHQMLVNDQEQGNPRDYDIKVDELKVVQRTNDPERFFLHEEFVQPETACITINLYDGNSRRCTKYQLYFGDVQAGNSASTLSGIENTINEKISSERKQWEYEQMKKEKDALEQKLGEAEEYADELEEKLTTMHREFNNLKSKRVTLAEMNGGKLLGFATDYLVKNHPAITQKIPLLSGLSGLLTGEEGAGESLLGTGTIQETGTAREKEGTATFNKKEAANTAQMDASTEYKLEFFRNMEEAFTMQQLEKVVEIIKGLAASPDQIDDIHGLLYEQPSQNNKAA
jgi:hypothetical protein